MKQQRFTMPPLEWVRAFEAAARCGSFTAAAAETGLTQSAISQRIGHLEKRLGTLLFYRQARSIALTVEGEAWLPHVCAALNALHDSSEALFAAGAERMTISASQSMIELWLLPRLAEIERVFRGQISVQTMVLGAHDAAQDGVVRIRYGTGDWPHHHKLQLFEERIVPLASPSLVARGGSWMDWPRISYAGPRPGWQDWAAHFGIPTTPVARLRFDTFLSALGAARAGLGVVLASLPLSAEDIAQGRLVRLGEDVLPHHESYWAIAGTDALRRSDWDRLAAVMAYPE